MKAFTKVLITVLLLAVITGVLVHIGSYAAFVSGGLLAFTIIAAPLIAGMMEL